MITREQIVGLLKVAACPASCDNGVVVRDHLHGEIEQCQFCFEREKAIADLQAVEPAAWQSQQAQVPEGLRDSLFSGWRGCSNHDCIVTGPKRGMGTNGSCSCLHDASRAQLHMLKSRLQTLLTASPHPAVPDERSHLIALLGVMCGWFEDLAKIAGWTPNNANAAWAGYRAAKAAIAPSRPAPAAVPDEAFNLIEAIRAELTWSGWRKTSSRDWVMDRLSELLSMITASPVPDHAADVRKMVAPDVSALEKAAQKLWRESYNCESDFIQAVVDALSKQEEEENDRNN